MTVTNVKLKDGEARIIHHSDWSGEAIIKWKLKDEEFWSQSTMPGKILLAISEKAAWEKVKDNIISHIEGLM